MLVQEVTANIPAADLARARAFYADVLGLTPVHEMEGIALVYRLPGGSQFSVYETEHAGRAGHTIAQWHVEDVPAVARDLAAKGVRFDHFDAPGLEWDGDVAFTEGMGHAAWFRDSEDNVMCLDSGFPE